MMRERRTVVYDAELRVEAYHFEGVAQAFPAHAHEYYVLGVVRAGVRKLLCRGRQYVLRPGCVLLLNPRDAHACTQCSPAGLDYYAFNISVERMRELMLLAPFFAENVVLNDALAAALLSLHEAVQMRAPERVRTAALGHLMQCLEPWCTGAAAEVPLSMRRACALLGRGWRAEDICRRLGWSKSTLLRVFSRTLGMSPHRYLTSLRIGRAQLLLARGAPPAEAALLAGFADQSHLTHTFSRLMGFTPGAYRAFYTSYHHAPK